MAFLTQKSWCFPKLPYETKNAESITSISVVTCRHFHCMPAVVYGMCHTRFSLPLKKDLVIELNSNTLLEHPLTLHKNMGVLSIIVVKKKKSIAVKKEIFADCLNLSIHLHFLFLIFEEQVKKCFLAATWVETCYTV